MVSNHLKPYIYLQLPPRFFLFNNLTTQKINTVIEPGNLPWAWQWRAGLGSVTHHEFLSLLDYWSESAVHGTTANTMRLEIPVCFSAMYPQCKGWRADPAGVRGLFIVVYQTKMLDLKHRCLQLQPGLHLFITHWLKLHCFHPNHLRPVSICEIKSDCLHAPERAQKKEDQELELACCLKCGSQITLYSS